jgi:hypothetical protein
VGGRVRLPARLPCQVLMIGCLAAAMILRTALPGWAQNPPPGGAGPSAASRADQTARTTSLDDKQPPPGPIIISQVHNAPGWLPSHTYTYATGPATRVVSGAGWNPANGRFEPGQTLDAYQLLSTGSCTSASSGGPSGNGSSITDGTCTWKYLSNVDYISISGWAFDNRPWKGGTLYHLLDYVVSDSPLRAYTLTGDSCTSTVAPTGNGSQTKGMIVTSDGCKWQYQADIIYTSGKSYIPTETSSRGGWMVMAHANYEAQLWNDREYEAARNGEALPIRVQDHNDYRSEGSTILGCTASCFHVVITTAPGESFRDSLTSSDPLSGYDPSKGVAIRNSQPLQWPYEPAGIDVHDNYVDVIGLQVKSVHGAAVNGMLTFGNVMTVRHCILEGGSHDEWTSNAAVTTDTSSVIANSLIISHGPIGIAQKYPGFVLHSTIVTPDRVTNSVGIVVGNKWVFDDTTVSNTAIFGFSHAVGHLSEGTSWSPKSSNNTTDAPADDSGKAAWAFDSRPGVSTVDHLPGAAYGVPIASAFVQPGRDWRPSGGSRLRGAGGAFGTFAVNCVTAQPSCPQRTTYNFDSPNIIGAARPNAGRYDVGAW